MNQRVGIDIEADIQGVKQATDSTAAGVDHIGKAADNASKRIKELEKNVLELIKRLDQLGKAGAKGFGVPGPASSPGAVAPGVPGVPSGPAVQVRPAVSSVRIPPPHRSPYGYNFTRFAHSGLHQGLHGLGQMAGTPGLASVVSGGLRYGLAGMAFAGLGAGIAGLVQAHGIATQESHSTDFLKRQLGDIGVNFDVLRDLNRTSTAGYGISSVESASYARQFARGANLRGIKGLNEELRNAYGFSRSYGMDPGAGVGFFSSMRGLRVTIDDASSKKLAATLAESIERGGNAAQAQEVMAAVQQFASSAARQTFTMPNVEAFAGSLSSLTRMRLPGLDAQGAGSLLMQADQSMRQGGAKGEASLNVAYAALARANPGLSAFGSKALMGLGLFGTGKDLAASPWGKLTGSRLTGDTTNFEAVRDLIHRFYGKDPETFVASMQGFFGLNEQQSSVLAQLQPDQLGNIQALMKRRGIDFAKINSGGMQSIAGIAGAKNMGDLTPYIRDVMGRKDISASDKEALRKAVSATADTGDFTKTQDTLTDILSRADQEMTDGKKSLEVQKQMETALARLGEGLIPATNMIRDYMGRIVNVFAGSSPEANAYNEFRKKQDAAADMEKALQQQVQRGEISPETADKILGRQTGWRGAQVDGALLDALKSVESGGNARAVSKAGAMGPYQLMPDTAKMLGVKDPFNDAEARPQVQAYLERLRGKYGGDMANALRAYNWGEGNMDAWLKTGRGVRGQIMPIETIQYADKVMRQLGGRVEDFDPGATARRAQSGRHEAVDVRSTVDITLRDPRGNPVAPVAIASGRRAPALSGG